MLLFKPEHVIPIDSGTKTETRRFWKKQRVTVGSIQKAKTEMLSKDYFALLKINEVYRQPLTEISEESAQREGGYTKEEYIVKFFEINPDAPKDIVPFVVVFDRIAAGNKPIEYFTGGKQF